MQRWKIMLKKVLLITAALAGVSAFVVLITSAMQKQNKLQCTGANVRIDYESGLSFVNEKEVVERIQFVCNDSLQNLKVSLLNLNKIENDLEHMAFIDSAEVYFNQKNVLQVHVNQKRPILRIINSDGVSYYLTDKNQTMPLCSTFTARVPIALGKVLTNESDQRDSMVQAGLFQLVSTIGKDSFLSAFIDQIVIDEKGEAELIPLASEHTVLFGFAHENTSEKLQRLKTFYKEAMPRKGWNIYEKLNVKFSNQVVCVKREVKLAADTVSTINH
jgi:cell division protein FtsQ